MSIRFRSLPREAQIYLSIVTTGGLLAIGHSIHSLFVAPIGYQWFILAALTLLSGSITVKLPSIPATISVSETFVFASILLFGTAAGTITVALDGLIISLWLQRTSLGFYKVLFNTAAPSLSIWIASHVFFLISGPSPFAFSAAQIPALLPSLFVLTVTYFLLNSWLMAIAMSFERPITALQVWRQNFLWLSLNFFSGASVAVLLVSVNREVTLSALAVIIPLLIISYLTYHTSIARVDDANRHLTELNRLYLSTIETLAMAIDAKDQVTHGHVRRVQVYSVSLARQLGVKDAKLIKAIEAASLLHDMGKLAIPEHILNKPGKLTLPEFEVMKLHASIGADILAAIDFPYPVVPIVRHHHENWDGTGYPDHLSGTDIPIGARILAVIDCFDALTSDRPYRQKLSESDALRILGERRGLMYDPLVVDTFAALSSQTLTSHVRDEAESIGRMVHIPTVAASQVASSRSLFRRLQTPTNPGRSRSLTASYVPYGIDVLGSYLSDVLNKSLVVLYLSNPTTGELDALCAWGFGAESVTEMTIPFDQELSRSIYASNHKNRGSEVARHLNFRPPDFQRVLDVRLLVHDQTIGFLAVYAAPTDSLTDSDCRRAEFIGHRISTALANILGPSKANIAPLVGFAQEQRTES